MKPSRCLLLLSLAVVLTGCNTTSLFHAPARFMFNRKQTDKVTRILCLWEAAEGVGLDGNPSRGFAGQILFFSYGDPSPVPVKGTVNIYEYDNFNPDDLNPVPVHKFTFDSGGWNAHVTNGTLGYSYNVFLPYVVPNPGRADCGLKVEFVPENGRTVSSPYTAIPLSGRLNRHAAETAISRDVVRNEQTKPATPPAATAAAVTSTTAASEDKLESLTIELPKQKRRRR
ncbi:MAG: hypothetical protein R3C19_17195 [Planctomycetaceae bacterium]